MDISSKFRGKETSPPPEKNSNKTNCTILANRSKSKFRSAGNFSVCIVFNTRVQGFILVKCSQHEVICVLCSYNGLASYPNKR